MINPHQRTYGSPKMIYEVGITEYNIVYWEVFNPLKKEASSLARQDIVTLRNHDPLPPARKIALAHEHAQRYIEIWQENRKALQKAMKNFKQQHKKDW